MERFAELGTLGLEHAGIDANIIPAVVAAFEDRANVPELEVALDEAEMPIETRGDLWMLLGEDDRAIRALLAAADGSASDKAITWYAEGRGVRLHPRFAEFAAKTGLLEYWQQFGMPDDCRLLADRLACGFTVVAEAPAAR